MKPSVRSLFLGVAIAFFFTLTLAALAQEKPAATATPAAEAPAAEARPLRRLDEPAVEKTDEAPAAPTKAKPTGNHRNEMTQHPTHPADKY